VEEVMTFKQSIFISTILVLSLVPVSSGFAQSTDCTVGPKTFETWLDCEIRNVAAPLVNQRETSRQVELPSIAENTTSLVDQTSAPDLLGLGLNLAGLNSKGDGSNGSSPSVTTSAYALYAAALQHDPLDPDFYAKHADLRRFYFTFGEDNSEEKTNGRAMLFGSKILILNYRDASNPRNRTGLIKISERVKTLAVGSAKIADQIQRYLYEQLAFGLGFRRGATEAEENANQFKFLQEHLNGDGLQATLSNLTSKQRDEIKAIIAAAIESRVAFTEEVHRSVGKIRRAPQLSLTFQTKQRSDLGTDEYRGGLLFDYGLYQRVNLTINGTFDYRDSRITGADKRGGRLAMESNFQLTPERTIAGPNRPFMFSTSGEAKWLSGSKPTYTGQLKLTIPLFDGINLPLSISLANKTGLIDESTIRGRFGFTFDLTKLLTRPK
jgi:hypothetical protein